MPSALFLTSPLLQGSGFRHAFFLRHRGWSTGPYDSLNFSVDVGDRPTAVTANLGLAAVELGVEPDRLCWMRQVHGNGVLVLEAGTRSAHHGHFGPLGPGFLHYFRHARGRDRAGQTHEHVHGRLI